MDINEDFPKLELTIDTNVIKVKSRKLGATFTLIDDTMEDIKGIEEPFEEKFHKEFRYNYCFEYLKELNIEENIIKNIIERYKEFSGEDKYSKTLLKDFNYPFEFFEEENNSEAKEVYCQGVNIYEGFKNEN